MPSREEVAAYNKQRYEKIIAAGKCVKCKKPRDGASRWRCKACLRKLAEYAKSRSRGWMNDPTEVLAGE